MASVRPCNRLVGLKCFLCLEDLMPPLPPHTCPSHAYSSRAHVPKLRSYVSDPTSKRYGRTCFAAVFFCLGALGDCPLLAFGDAGMAGAFYLTGSVALDQQGTQFFNPLFPSRSFCTGAKACVVELHPLTSPINAGGRSFAE
ncbi:unnamed protein product [Symbiodinium sp. CCMP2592]|nr:unnamed protein product [Symbiodinium sp. CCMP2592]